MENTDRQISNQRDEFKSCVFISYARRDTELVIPLTEKLRENNIRVLRDADEILPAEEWRERLKNMIVQADQVIFFLSPDSAQSKECAWEVDIATEFKKRMVPVVIRDLGKVEASESLSKLNYIFFTPPADPEVAFEKLQSALLTDISWVREHARLGELAHDWEKQGHRNDLALRGESLDSAEKWLITPSDEGLQPTLLHQQFIHSSRKQETARTRRNVFVLGSLLVAALVAGAIAWFQYGRAVSSEQRVFSTTTIASWQQLEEPKEACVTMREYIGEAGVRALYCFASNILSYRSVEKLFGGPVYLKGPHHDGRLYVQADSFGHYNPDFVDWVGQKLLPKQKESTYVASTQALYDKHMKNLIRAFYRTYVQFSLHPEPFIYERQFLAEMIEGKRPWSYMGARWQENTMRDLINLDPNAEALNFGNVSVALRFWQRRSLDNTSENFFKLIDQIAMIYDTDWHSNTAKPVTGLPSSNETTNWSSSLLPVPSGENFLLNPDVFPAVLE